MLAFFITMLFIFWRPKGLNEAIPATIGAFMVILCGSVSLTDLGEIGSKVTGASVTILATMIMAIALESFGFFYWVAAKLLQQSRGSGIKLFWLTNSLCFLMTIFLNNDGSVLITTPILLLVLKYLGLKKHQKTPYLISGVLIATASSAPIGVSNIVNLISLKMIGMDLYLHTAMMFVPSMMGLLFMACLLFIFFYKRLPKSLPDIPNHFQSLQHRRYHPLHSPSAPLPKRNQTKIMLFVLAFVFLVRISLFAASYTGISVPLVAVIGSIILLAWRWVYFKTSPKDLLYKSPWHIFIFAFTMYILIYGLHNIGFTELLVNYFEPMVSGSLSYATFVSGISTSVFSNLFNNHPALMISTFTLTEMSLNPSTAKIIYLANIIGSDIGSLLLPIGTLATLIWMHILKQHDESISWGEYLKTTILIIPLTVLFTLTCLYFWISWLFL
ncbi:arsenic transporter [Bacillus mojavensis]|uniref:arsenic transporter n=1 Tax=Bacillus TaxID=1386 RepID=UPI001E3817B4|nr:MULTISPECIES: arsenic transporter [Bacillus]MCC2931167.1 arsenic transporter [Bacillus sp. LBG-1-113]MCY9090041.1 arsenic transporter [Bacillus mojavensis]MEC1669393.1 arsenic transporter [Bacillus mojavensis]MEC1799309.1 arsenic transporter [Bacillus mojavensis]